MDSIEPAAGAGTSTVTLSVSSSRIGSSRATLSPSFLNQRATVASVTDSPIAGTLISMLILSSSKACADAAQSQCQSVVQEGGQFGQMLLHQARRSGSIFRPAGVARPLTQQFLQTRRHEAPGALVLGLFLAPDQFGLGKALHLFRQNIVGEGIELFQAQDLDAGFAPLLALFHQVEIDFAGAEDHPLDVGILHQLD